MVFEVLAVESEDGLLVATDEKARRHIPARLALNLGLKLFWEMLFSLLQAWKNGRNSDQFWGTI